MRDSFCETGSAGYLKAVKEDQRGEGMLILHPKCLQKDIWDQNRKKTYGVKTGFSRSKDTAKETARTAENPAP